jgi:selenocysteine lyase/cysteine desulfurase
MSLATPVAAKLLKDQFAHTHSEIPAMIPAAKSMAMDEAYWDQIRSNFPITKELLYMNNGTMGPSPRVVTERVMKRIEHVDSTGDYGGDYEGIRKAIGSVIGASGDEIAYTHNVSEAISIIASGVEMTAGDEVLLTDQEHAGNAVPWLARAKRDGIVVKFVTLAPDDATVMNRLNDLITPRTRVIAVPHVTCTTGQVLPIKAISKMAHAKNIWVMADGAHPPGMMVTDVKDLGVDAYTSCGHKWLCGPKGIGFLYLTDAMMQHVMPTWCGAESDKYWGYDGKLDFLPTASRYDFATQNFALFDGLQAAIEFMSAIGFDKIQSRIEHLTSYMRQQLSATLGDRFQYLTPATSVTGLTTIKLANMKCGDFWETMVAKHKIRTRVVHESKLDANRLSLHIYSSMKDVDRFIEAAKTVLA